MTNKDAPGSRPDGIGDTKEISRGSATPPVNTRMIGDALNEKGISWAYYGGAYNAAVALQHNPTSTDPTVQIGAAYCNICNFESYTNSIMGDPAQRAAHLQYPPDSYATLTA